MTVRVCPICDIANCATHRPRTHTTKVLVTKARARAWRLDHLAGNTLSAMEANFHRTTAELLRDMALKLETQND